MGGSRNYIKTGNRVRQMSKIPDCIADGMMKNLSAIDGNGTLEHMEQKGKNNENRYNIRRKR